MRNEFQDPPVNNRIRPFWFLNGNLDKDEMRHQITEMKDKGLGGFVMCARQGLTIPYLSEEWFETSRFAVDVAKNLGMEVWLYDEFPYPSGISGGEVTIRHPECCQHELVFTDTMVENGRAEISLGKVRCLLAMAYPVRDGETKWEEGRDVMKYIGIIQPVEICQYNDTTQPVLNRKRYFSYGPEKKLAGSFPGGTWRIITASAKKIADFKYYGDFIDPANPEAVDAFIETTYDAYKEALGDEFGKTVKGIYGDETHFLGDHFWSFQLPDYYQTKYGEDIIPFLGAIHDRSYPDAAKIRYRYFQCMHELLRDRYHKKLYRWCEKNGIRYATEIPVMRMSGQKYSHVPGGDPNHDKLGLSLETAIDRDFLGFRSNTKVLSAIARQYDREDSLVESFHSIGWSMTLQDAKWLTDRETLMGASFHVFHAFYYTVDGITKHDAAPSQFLQNPYWEHYKKLSDYCGRSAGFIAGTDSSAKTAILHPVTSWWTSLINPMLRMKYTGNDRAEQKEIHRMLEDYLHICKSLIFHQVDYDDLDAETMCEGVIENGVIQVGKAAYDTIIVPPVKNMERFAGKRIKEFMACGGKVIFCGLTPYEDIDGYRFEEDFGEVIDLAKLSRQYYENGTGEAEVFEAAGGTVSGGLPDHGVFYITAPGGMVQSNAGKLLADTVKRISPTSFSLQIPRDAYGRIVSCRREDESCDYLFVTCCEGDGGLCRITVKGRKPFYELDLETGERTLIGSTDYMEVNIGPWEARLYAVPKDKQAQAGRTQIPETAGTKSSKGGKEKKAVLELPLEQEAEISIEGHNVLRLEDFTLSVNNSPEFQTIPFPFIEQVKRASAEVRKRKEAENPNRQHAADPIRSLEIDFKGGFGFPARHVFHYPVDLRYKTSFQIENMPSKLYLMHDARAVMGEYSVSVNGTPLAPGHFETKRLYDQNNQECDILSCVKEGRNEIQVHVTAQKEWHGLSDPFYLLGDFGVVSRDTIGEKIKRGSFGASAPDAFRFYSGKISYAFEMELPGGEITLRIPYGFCFYECATLYVDGKECGTRAFMPYDWKLAADENRGKVCRIRLVVTNTLIHMLEGARYDYRKKRIVEY